MTIIRSQRTYQPAATHPPGDQLELWDIDLTPQEPPLEVGFEAGWLGEKCPGYRDPRLNRHRNSYGRAKLMPYVQRGWEQGRAARARYEQIRRQKDGGRV